MEDKPQVSPDKTADNLVPKQELDARGLYCPEPVMLLHNKIRDIEVGELLRIIATDPSTTRDIPKFCMFLGHDLVESSEAGAEFSYLIRKNAI